MRAYERVVQLQPDSALDFLMLGTVHISEGRPDEALPNFEKANAIRPRYTAYSNIGTIHFWNGDDAKAADAYARAIELTPNVPTLHTNLGDTLRKPGRSSVGGLYGSSRG